MTKIVILVEEKSMEAYLRALLPRAFPGLQFHVLPHQGKSDLMKSIPLKTANWNEGPEVDIRFVILHDQDTEDCKALKSNIISQIETVRKHKVRIVVRELESWHLGELDTVDFVYGTKLGQSSNKSKFRNPDTVKAPARCLEKLVPQYQKVSGSRQLGARVNWTDNQSPSFKAFMNAVRELSS